MIITKDFLDSVLTGKVSQKYNQYDYELMKEHVDWAYKLIGLHHLQAVDRLSQRENFLRKTDLEKRNKFCNVFQCIANEIDYGFKEGDTVVYMFSPHTERVGTVLKIEGDMAMFDDGIIPCTWMIRKVDELEQESFEQLDLFEEEAT